MKKEKKIEWITSLRAIACLAVVMIHVIEGWIKAENVKIINNIIYTGGGVIDRNRWLLDCVIFRTITRFAVPCFIMITGCLLLNPKKNVTVDKIKVYLKRIFLVLATFGFAFAFIEAFISSNNKSIINIVLVALSNLVQGKAWTHMWYLYCLIGLYILTPLLRKFVKLANEREVKFTLICLFVLSSLIPTINHIFKLNISTFYLEGLNYLFIYLGGYYISCTNIFKEKNLYIGGIIGIVGFFLCCYFNVYNSQINVFMILEAMAIVKLFASEKIKIKPNKFINLIAKYSFTIYLVHCFWINILYKGFHLYPNILPIFIGEISVYIYALGLSLISAMILNKLPFFKKILK